jgi:hypothetical protein
MTKPLTPKEELAIAQQRLKCLTDQREAQMGTNGTDVSEDSLRAVRA